MARRASVLCQCGEVPRFCMNYAGCSIERKATLPLVSAQQSCWWIQCPHCCRSYWLYIPTRRNDDAA